MSQNKYTRIEIFKVVEIETEGTTVTTQFLHLVYSPFQTHREGRCCRRWAKMAALWCAVCRQGLEPGVGL